MGQIDSLSFFGMSFGRKIEAAGFEASVTLYYYLFLVLVVFSVIISHRLQLSRVGRAWMAIREDEIAAKAMGINTRNLKLLAFGMGATLVVCPVPCLFCSRAFFISPESFSLMESVMIGHGGAGRHRPSARGDSGRGGPVGPA